MAMKWQSFDGEIRRLRQTVERLKSQNFDPFMAVDRIPEPYEFGDAVLGLPLDRWQRAYMKRARDVSYAALVACRQSGKSTVTALFVAWCLIFVPGFRCLIASRSLRQASHYLTAVRHAVLAVVPRKAMRQLNRLSMELPNGSEIISIPCAQPDAGRGFSPHLVILDEAAFAPEALFTAITPSLAATQGALHMLSSPNGRQGYFFEACEGKAEEIFWTKRIPWNLCPRLTPERMEQERILLGDIYFRQEYMAEFITPMGAFFGHSAILNMQEEEDPPLDDLELPDMEALLDSIMPVPVPSMNDLQASLDRSDRVRRMLYD